MLFMHMVGMMVLFSSSPPTSWGTQCSVSSRSSSAAIDIEANHRLPKSKQGGLSNLFYSNASRFPQHASQSTSDVLDSSPSNSCSVGSLRSSTQGESGYGMGTWENYDIRFGAANISASSSLKTREHSPVSVLQGPVARSGTYGSPAHSARESVSGGGLPSWDSHIERVWSRRKPSFSGEKDRRMIARSVGFEICNTAVFPGEQQVRASMGQPTESETAVISSSEPIRVEGFGSSAFVCGNSPVDTLTLPLYVGGRGYPYNSLREAAPGILEAREKILRLAEQANGLSSVSTEDSSKVETSTATTADEILKGAQDRFNVFYDPVVVKAFRMAEEAHRGQVRRNGDMFLSHCVETALTLAAIGVSNTVIAAGLLHDAIDDSNFCLKRLRDTLGEDVANLVIGVSKLSEFSQLARDSNTVGNPMEADRLRTMILALVDVRVVLVKIADRLHNLRTLEALPSHKQIGIATETLGIFAPLANRLGIWRWKAELEDLCFKYLKPEDHQDLSMRLSERCREGLVMSSIKNLDEALRIRGVEFIDLCGRPKNLYSVYKKMMKKKRSLEEILDVIGLRLIVSDEKSCYEALEIVHQLWRHMPGKSKDYIVDSKPNGYKSLHTVVIGSDGYPLEVQIRTMKMHHQAEYGLAAHWRYKEDNSEHSAFSFERIEWARWVLTWHSEIMDTKLRVSPLGADLKPPCPFPVHNKGCPYEAHCCEPTVKENDPVFVVKMEDEHIFVREMPPGSTIGDLVCATASHVDFLAADSTSANQNGLRVKVNHEFVNNLEQKLRMGDFVEVVTTVEKPCGKIALEFQREQLKRLYLDGGSSTDDQKATSLDLSLNVAGI